jgi:sugar/nucleoside kinase (ribokinase family)
MNVEEAGCSWFPSQGDNDERAIGEPLPTSELPRFAEHCLRRGVQAVCVTLDERGCVVYFRVPPREMQEDVVGRVPLSTKLWTPQDVATPSPPTWHSGFLEYHDFVTACRYGNAMGAQRCAGSELRINLPLSETNRQISRAYGDVIPHV